MAIGTNSSMVGTSHDIESRCSAGLRIDKKTPLRHSAAVVWLAVIGSSQQSPTRHQMLTRQLRCVPYRPSRHFRTFSTRDVMFPFHILPRFSLQRTTFLCPHLGFLVCTAQSEKIVLQVSVAHVVIAIPLPRCLHVKLARLEPQLLDSGKCIT